VRLTPKASRNGLQGLAEDAAGGVALKVQVTAVPENGKANAALCKLLAKDLKLPRSAVTVVAGATDRRKILRIDGDPVDVAARLRDKLSTPSG
jgi:uncharacterized protein YggU (UPF0235/DUF167 family)